MKEKKWAVEGGEGIEEREDKERAGLDLIFC